MFWCKYHLKCTKEEAKINKKTSINFFHGMNGWLFNKVNIVLIHNLKIELGRCT
jgi:hypothetical protein